MFNIKVKINGDVLNFGTFKDLLLEMQYTNTKEVLVECSYCFNPIAKLQLTLADVELLASDKLLDQELIDTIENFVKATKKLL